MPVFTVDLSSGYSLFGSDRGEWKFRDPEKDCLEPYFEELLYDSEEKAMEEARTWIDQGLVGTRQALILSEQEGGFREYEKDDGTVVMLDVHAELGCVTPSAKDPATIRKDRWLKKVAEWCEEEEDV